MSEPNSPTAEKAGENEEGRSPEQPEPPTQENNESNQASAKSSTRSAAGGSSKSPKTSAKSKHDSNEELGPAEQVTNQIANNLFGEAEGGENESPQKSNRSTSRSSSKKSERNSSQRQSSPQPDSEGQPEDMIGEEEEDYTDKDEDVGEYSFSKKQSMSTSKRNSSRLQTIPIKKKLPRRQKEPEPSPREVDAALELLLHRLPPEDFDPATLRCCIRQLQELKKDSVQNKNYREANFYAELIKSSQKAADVAGFSTQCTQKLGYLMDKQADAQEKVDKINENWIEQFQEFEAMINSKIEALTEQQTRELAEFDNKMPNDLPSKYKKHSVEYVLLRKRERLLIRNEDYLTADSVKRKADALEKEELTKRHMELQDDLQTERNALIKKHNQQYEAFALWMNSKRHDMLNARDKDLEGPVKRLEHYTMLVDRIEKKGLPPNPYYGFTTNRVSRKESIKAVRTAAQTPLERDPKQHQPREKPVIPNFRPSSSMRAQKMNKTKSMSGQNSQRSNSQLPPC